MNENIDLKRRQLVTGSAIAAIGLVGLPSRVFAQEPAPKPAALPKYTSFKDPNALIIHSNNTLETKRGAMGASAITPEDTLYIRNNVSPPDESVVANPDAWKISIEGVAQPREMTVGELKTLGLSTVTMVLQCSGNGRAYFDHKPGGTPWQVGAAGCVMWTGVPLRAVVDALGGLAEGARFITGTGGEVIPKGLEPKSLMVERSVPVETLDTVMLAWDMNGEAITLAHGGPLRMIVPGYTGVNNIKYIAKLAFTPEETDALIQRTRYRMHPVGTKGGPEYPSVWEMSVKSWITAPLEDRATGRVQITGLAFGGIHGVEKVEVSSDGGETWSQAQFVGPDLGRYAWRPFVLPASLAPGKHVLVSRATDTAGTQQPRDFEPNEAGYNHNGWLGPAVTITVA